MEIKSRKFKFVRYNYTDTLFEDFINCRYIIYSKKVNSLKIPFLQGLIIFNDLCYLRSVKELMNDCYISICYTDLDEAIEKVKENGEWKERGDLKAYWQNLLNEKLIKKKKKQIGLRNIQDIMFYLYVKRNELFENKKNYSEEEYYKLSSDISSSMIFLEGSGKIEKDGKLYFPPYITLDAVKNLKIRTD